MEKKSVMWRFALMCGLFVVLLSGCAVDGVHSTKTTIWNYRDQFVRVEGQGREGCLPNSHPVALSAAQIYNAMQSLRVQEKGKKEIWSVFTLHELESLCERIASALSQASEGQDVTFAVIGMHPGTFALEPRVTTGRVFFRDNRLHLIFGMVHGTFRENEDRRIKPFTMGSRHGGFCPQWELVSTPGVENFDSEGSVRQDWVVIELDRVGTVPVVEPVAKGTRKDIQEENAGTTMLKGEMIESRLRLLEELRQKNLITEPEYQAKRQNIIDEI